MKRLFYIHMDKPLVFINPVLVDRSPEMFTLWDDCMCFPNLLVRVERHKEITLQFLDAECTPQEWKLEGDLSELAQHEYDHLNGILCTMRALDNRSFR